jgi:alanyl aminopeptidase
VRSSFEAGRTSFGDALAALSPLARSGERTLARAPMGLYELALDRLLDAPEAARARRSAVSLYAADARRLGFSARAPQDPETQLWRAELLSFLALTVEDAGVRREAARRGRAYLGFEGDGAIHPEAVPTDLTDLAVRVAIEDGGAPIFEHALALLSRSTDPVVRQRLVGGLASAREPALRRRALELVLDERLRQNETFRPLMAQAGDPEGAELAWAWLVEHYDAVVARLGPGYAAYLPYAATGFCSEAQVEPTRAFFTPRVASTQGGPRNLAAALESIQLCAARAAFARDAARAVFAR